MKNFDLSFAVAGSSMSIIFFIIVNYVTTSHYPWFIYPAFFLLLWPIAVHFVKRRKFNLLSVFISTLIIIFLIIENYINSPDYPWFLYAVYPFILSTILVVLGKSVASMSTAVIGSTITILYYLILNLDLSPQYPWVIFPAFVILWWPLGLYLARKKKYFEFSIQASLFISLFFISVNVVSTPGTIWAVYPIFCVLWWPLSMYYFVYKRS